MARSSVSLLPISESAGLLVAAESAGGSAEVAVAATATASVVDAEDVVRGRVGVTLFAD